MNQVKLIVAKRLKIGDTLNLKRQPDNEFDPFAIQVLSHEMQLGFVPGDLAKHISFQMDIMGMEIKCKVAREFGTRVLVVYQIDGRRGR